MKYLVGKTPRLRAQHNVVTWARLIAHLGASSADFDQLVLWCGDHPGGGKGFIRYCIGQGWLVGSGASDQPRVVGQEAHRIGSSDQGGGIYLAYPTSPALKPIYPGYKTLVNDRHTKVGKVESGFSDGQRRYLEVFDGEVCFRPLREVPLERLRQVEKRVLRELAERYKRVGRAREWFDTDDREAVASLVVSTIEEELARRL
jgi:hypothetical protein